MDKEKKTKSTKTTEAAEKPKLRRFFFPDVLGGMTIEAPTLEEANVKADALRGAVNETTEN